MKIERFVYKKAQLGASGWFSVRGSFGAIDSYSEYKKEEGDNSVFYTLTTDKVKLCAQFTVCDNGVVVRKDYLENLTDSEIEINKLSSRFHLEGNEYEVYTQYSGWQHESLGEWQKLVTQVTAETEGIRTCDGATPIMGMHNLYTGKNVVFHLIPNCQWKMSVKKFPLADREVVVLETGFQDSALKLIVEPKERIYLPEVVFFEAENKKDLDAYKLHDWFNATYPRKKSMPIMYNSWLYSFDYINIDQLKEQATTAKELGFEAFMIDAGWFGEGERWGNSVGDWEENLTGGPKGRLLELSEHVRSLGLTFGLWFEPERAWIESKSVKAHPEYYINNTFLNFADKEARDFIFNVICKQMDKYNIGWIKFDFNATIPQDLTGGAFYRYWQGYREFIKAFKKRYPDVYMTNCGGGGFRLELGQATMFDSFWTTDNQGPYDGIRIIKDTLKRMPTCLLERWNVIKYVEGLMQYANPSQKIGRVLNCNNATWDFIIGINPSFSDEFVKGGPLGFSCDIAELPKEQKEKWKNIILEYKKDREFFVKANARILVDTDKIIAIEYSNDNFDRCYVQLFTKVMHAEDFILYPIVDEKATYKLNGKEVLGNEIKENGIVIEKMLCNWCMVFDLKKIK